MHPIAGQGVNVGYRDAAALAQVLVEGARLGLDLGDQQLLTRYQRWRSLDTFMVSLATDGLTRVYAIPGKTASKVRRFGMYAQRGSGKRSSYYSDYTFGCWNESGELLPVGKAYFGFTDEELRWLDRYVRQHTVNRFGPVREVDRSLVLEVAFDSIHRSTRHKSGLAMRFPRISRIRTDKPAAEADQVEALMAMAT